jgi:hypothetical protein
MEDFCLKMLGDCAGFTKGKLYACYKVIPGTGDLSSYFLTINDAGEFTESRVSNFGPGDGSEFARQEAAKRTVQKIEPIPGSSISEAEKEVYDNVYRKK